MDLFAGTTSAPNKTDTIDFVTVSSTGNATDFGNFTLLLQVLHLE